MTTAGQGRMAAVLFSDLVGSTELLSRVGEATFDGLRRAHFAALREAIGRSGGAEVKTTGDGLLATFSSAADAVGCAVGMQQAVAVHARSAGVPLAIRVGVSAGDVSFEDGDVFGTPVVEAARLVAAARGGQILATALVRGIAGGRSVAAFTDIGCLELKGLPTPVATCEVAWEPLPAPALPMPALLTDIGRIFVGREAQVDRLEQLWNGVAGGERRAVFVAGEPGIGKTRLAAELAAQVRADGAVVLAGRCDEDLGVPYQPFVEALRHFVDHTPTQDLGPRLGRYGGELARLVPELTAQVPDLPPPLSSDPETERYRLFDAVASWLGAASGDSPHLLVLDDLQWAAKPTLLLLRHVLRSSEARRLFVVGTYRDTDIGRGHPLLELLADLRKDQGIERFPLTGLDRAGVAAFIAAAAGHALPEEADQALVGAIWAETEGNPFFVAEVIRHLTESGAIERREGRWMATAPVEQLAIPEGVRDVVGRRLSRLSEEANGTLAVASVAGLEFDAAVVRGAGGFGEDELLSALEEAVTARLLKEVSASRYRFGHALVRATLYDEISAARRVALHRKMAEAIEEIHVGALDDYLPALAHHWARASAPAAETGKAVEYAARAGDRALTQLAHDEAVTYYRQALELLAVREGPPDEAQRLELLISLGEAQRRIGDPNHRQTLLNAAGLAQQQGDAGALARAALANYRGFWSATLTVDAERVAALEAALDAGDPVDSALRARLLANLAVELKWSGRRDRPLALSDQAVAMARRLGDPATLAHVLLANTQPVNVRERMANTEELLQVADRLGDPAAVAWTLVWRFCAAMELAEVDEADRSIDNLRRLAGELGQPMLRWVASYLTVGRVLLAGRLSEAERLALEARDLGLTAGQPDARLFFGIHRFYIRFDQGRVSELVDRLAEVMAGHERPLRRAYLALAYCELDRDDDARRVFEPLVSRLSDPAVEAQPGWLELLGTSAAVCAHLGNRSVAACLLDVLAPYADHLVGVITWAGSTSHYLGLLATALARFDEAEDRFAVAEAIHARIGAPAWLARTRLEWARMLLTRWRPGDTEQAHDLLGKALTTARELGLGNVERRTVALLTERAAR